MLERNPFSKVQNLPPCLSVGPNDVRSFHGCVGKSRCIVGEGTQVVECSELVLDNKRRNHLECLQLVFALTAFDQLMNLFEHAELDSPTHFCNWPSGFFRPCKFTRLFKARQCQEAHGWII